MTQPVVRTSFKTKKCLFSFVIGHSSIGWSVIDTISERSPYLQGCGSVLFPADDCLASNRRQLRRQRRHIRSTRIRIARMKKLLAHLGVLTPAELDVAGGPCPWKLAARVHAGGSLLSWPELWDVLRWYAHNRGYDGNRNWSRDDIEDTEDTEKEKAALNLMEKLGKATMCQTICAKLQIDPLSPDRKSSAIAYKTSNAAFPRDVVLQEVVDLMEKHVGKLPQVTTALITALCAENNTNKEGKGVRDVLRDFGFDSCLPGRFVGGLLFGQSIPRFNNRITGECPVSGEKRPLKDCHEFLEFRWAEMIANVTVRHSKDGERKSLTIEERAELTKLARLNGGFSAAEFRKAVMDISGAVSSNVELLLTTPGAEEALVLDPARRFVRTNGIMKAIWLDLPESLQKRITGRWNKRRRVTLQWLLKQPEAPEYLEKKIRDAWEMTRRKKRKGDSEPVWGDRLKLSIAPNIVGGRAPYGRAVMMQAVEQVRLGKHPREAGGVLEITVERREREWRKEIDELTNNHLVRHRLKIMLRLLGDMVKNYADGDPGQADRCVFEVSHDLVEFSGKTKKEVTQELGVKLKNFRDVSSRLESELEGTRIPIIAGLIRKARIADDLDWICPYTAVSYDAATLARGGVDKDHVIPRSLQPSDSLDSLVVTFEAVNKWKASRTAWKFVEEEQGKQVPGRPDLTIVSLKAYETFVSKLAGEKKPGRFTPGQGSLDDKLRMWSRKQKLLLRDYEDKEFNPYDLGVSSHLARLCMLQMEKCLPHLRDSGRIVSIPRSITRSVGRFWNCLGCLAQVCPDVLKLMPTQNDQKQVILDGEGKPLLSMQVRPKGEICDITHLRHALDASVMAFASILLPDTGKLWEQLMTRKVPSSECVDFEEKHGWSGILELVSPTKVGDASRNMRLHVGDLPVDFKRQIIERLKERRVVQHVPADMSGARLEMNTWRVVKNDGDLVTLRQRTFAPKDVDPLTGARKRIQKEAKERAGKIVGLREGKLSALKGALVIGENYGVALDPEIKVIAFHQVKQQLESLRVRHGGRPVRVIRNGMVIKVASGTRQGTWRVISVKNTEAYGVALNLATPDGVKLARGNAPVISLIENGLEILSRDYCGHNSDD